MSEPVRVIVGPCRCPGTPHGDDWVDLAPRLSVTAGAAAMAAIRGAENTRSELEAAISASFLRHGILAWSFTDDARAPVAVTNATIAEQLDWATASDLAERCNELYAEDLFRPLAKRLAPSSSGGPTGESTSATTSSGPTPPTPSSPSSPADSDTTPSEAPAP